MSDYTHWAQTKQQARDQGDHLYYTGKGCQNGHDAPRYVKSGKCVECNKLAVKRHYRRNPYTRQKVINRATERQEQNNERHKQYIASYYQRNKEAAYESAKRWRARHHGTRPYIIQQMIARARRRARQYQIDYNLTYEYLVAIWPDDVVCPVLGIELDLSGEILHRCASIDRIDNTRGYVQGNVSVVSFRANSIKSDATLQELERLVEYMSN